jgi:hypothetical protein
MPDSDTADRAWSRWLARFAATLAVVGAAVFGFVVVMDPYSSGRLTPLTRTDVAMDNRLYANAGRVRNRLFDAAVFGTSVSVRLDPGRLSEATGWRFAMLGIEGVYPVEHLLLIRRFDRLRGGDPALLVVVLDDLWCAPERLNLGYVLPRWLYVGTTFQYLAKIVSPAAVRASYRRLMILLGLRGQDARLDGYDPTPWMPSDRAKRMQDMLAMSPPTEGPDSALPFPVLDDLQREVADFDPAHTLLMVFPPVYRNSLPVPGSAADRRTAACKARARTIASPRPRTDVLDLRVDGPKVGLPANFVDPPHFKDDIARDVEASIAERVKLLADAPAPGVRATR